jgi:hypothetical protein
LCCNVCLPMFVSLKDTCFERSVCPDSGIDFGRLRMPSCLPHGQLHLRPCSLQLSASDKQKVLGAVHMQLHAHLTPPHPSLPTPIPAA